MSTAQIKILEKRIIKIHDYLAKVKKMREIREGKRGWPKWEKHYDLLEASAIGELKGLYFCFKTIERKEKK